MATLDELIIRIEANTAQLRREMKRADKNVEKTTKSMARSLKKSDRAFGRLAKSASRLLPILGVAGLGKAARSAITDLAKLDDVAKKLGLTAEQLQELRFAGEEVGVAMNTTDMALQRFTRRLGEAANGTGELKGTLDKYNISVKNADGSTRKTMDVLGDLADVIKNTKSQSEALAISFKAFDSEGAALVSLMRRGAAGMEELRQKARDLGLVIDNQTVKAAKALDRQMDILTGKMSTIWKESVVGFADAFGLIPLALRDTAVLGRELEQVLSRIATQKKGIEAGDFFGLVESGPGKFRELERLEKRAEALRRAIAGPIAEIPVSPPRDTGFTGSPGFFVDPRSAAGPRERQKGIEAAQRALDDLDSQLLRSTGKMKALFARVGEQQKAAFQKSFEAGNLTIRQLEEAETKVDAITEANIKGLDKSTDAADRFGDAMNFALQNAILQGERLDKVLIRMIKSAALFGVDGKGGLLGGILSSATGSIATAFTLPGFAGGGSPQVGVPSIVGERGPEIFIPKVPGTILSNADSRRMGGRPVKVEVNMVFNPGMSNVERAEIQNALTLTARATFEAVFKELNAVKF